MIKLVASDLDGTLFTNSNKISDRTAKAVRAVQEQGVEFLVCTGRDYEQMNDMIEEAGIQCGSICMSGAAIYDTKGNREIGIPVPQEQVRTVYEVFREQGQFCDFRTEQGNFVIASEAEAECYYRNVLYKSLTMLGKTVPEYEIIKRMQKLNCLSDFAEFSGRRMEVYKMAAYSLDVNVLERIRSRLAGMKELSLASSFPVNLEITAAEAQKGAALERYARVKNIRNEEIMVLGDSDNDRSMFEKKFGCKVAMDNAEEEIKEMATYITASNEDDGVAYALEKFVLN